MTKVTYSNKFDELLEKPGIFVGNSSVLKIKAFMDGYIHAKWEDGVENEADPYNEFGEWIRKRFQIKTSHGWAEIVNFMSPDDAYAFNLTKELWGEYKSTLKNNSERE